MQAEQMGLDVGGPPLLLEYPQFLGMMAVKQEPSLVDEDEPPRQPIPSAECVQNWCKKPAGRSRRKSRWKLKFHHQALPPEYLDHYEASVQAAAAAAAAAQRQQQAESSGQVTGNWGTQGTGNCSSRRTVITSLASGSPRPPMKYSDLPYMGEITLDNCKPRRGRKPKKADICHLIYKNYGTILPGTPDRQQQQQQQQQQQSASTAAAAGAATALQSSSVPRSSHPQHSNRSDIQNRISSLLERRLTQGLQEEPLNLCIRDLDLLKIRLEQELRPVSPRAKRLVPQNGGTTIKRKRSAIFIPPMKTPSESSQHCSPTTEVSICKFKFTGGAKPSLQEKKSLSVDSGGNFRYYSGTGDRGSRGYEFFPAPATGMGILQQHPQQQQQPLQESHPTGEPGLREEEEEQLQRRGGGVGRRASRKSAQRERLEQTFKEKGFLIQTQQLESAEGATYCKFRQLRKFTRYLFRSWKDYLPGSVLQGELNGEPIESPASLHPPAHPPPPPAPCSP